MRIDEIDSNDLTAYKLTTIGKGVTGNLSKDYRMLVNDILNCHRKYDNIAIPKSSRNQQLIVSVINGLLNRITHIDDICVDIINFHTDIDAENIKNKLDNLYNSLINLSNKFV